MSTRCQVIVRDERQCLWFYRHCDGYPDGVRKTLDKFCKWAKKGRIRNNVEQAAGWLIVIGRQEYAPYRVRTEDGGEWQVGAYEPCACRGPHGDIEHLYVVDLRTATWKEVPIKGYKAHCPRGQ